MTTVPFDTLKFATKLEQSGFTPEQAKGATAAFADATGEQLATKTDLESLATKMDVKDTELRIVLWVFGAVGFQTLIYVGAILALFRFGH
jgi:hypothetical protein